MAFRYKITAVYAHNTPLTYRLVHHAQRAVENLHARPVGKVRVGVFAGFAGDKALLGGAVTTVRVKSSKVANNNDHTKFMHKHTYARICDQARTFYAVHCC